MKFVDYIFVVVAAICISVIVCSMFEKRHVCHCNSYHNGVDIVSSKEYLQEKYPKLNDNLYSIIEYNAEKKNLPEELVCSLIQSESNWDQFAISRSGARGYMQIMPVHYPKNPRALYNTSLNIEKGCMYLRMCLDASRGNVREAIRMYNQGIHGKRWEYKNWKYVDSVLGRL